MRPDVTQDRGRASLGRDLEGTVAVLRRHPSPSRSVSAQASVAPESHRGELGLEGLPRVDDPVRLQLADQVPDPELPPRPEPPLLVHLSLIHISEPTRLLSI